MWVNYDGDGDETLNPNTEWVRIQNQGSTALSLTGWWLRSAAQDYLRFPAGTAIKAHSILTVYVGKGTRTATKLYWGFSAPHFPNPDEPGAYGSGAYLFDPQGDLRSHTSFPCLYACSDSRTGQVAMKVNYDAPGDDQTNPNGEYVALTLKGTKAVDLSYTTLWSHGNTRELGGGTVLKPGERMIIHMGKGTNTRLNHYWGKTYAPLTNSGGTHDPAHHQRHQDRLLRLGHRPLLTQAPACRERALPPAGQRHLQPRAFPPLAGVGGQGQLSADPVAGELPGQHGRLPRLRPVRAVPATVRSCHHRPAGAQGDRERCRTRRHVHGRRDPHGGSAGHPLHHRGPQRPRSASGRLCRCWPTSRLRLPLSVQ